MPTYEFVIADVFTDAPLAGNQLAVFLDGAAVPEPLLQPLAREVGFSESVFCWPDGTIRIFTPGTELPFAGHPVLGTAAVLRSRNPNLDLVELHCARGTVPVRFDDRGRGTMVQPLPTWTPWAGDASALSEVLGGLTATSPLEVYDNGPHHLFFVVDNEDAVGALRPDFGALVAVLGTVQVSVVAPRSSSGHGGWKSRMFAPGVGVDEDPATGSAAGPLAVHLARHGRIGWGDEIAVLQGVELLRPSMLFARAIGDAGELRSVEVGGDTVIVGRGAFDLG